MVFGGRGSHSSMRATKFLGMKKTKTRTPHHCINCRQLSLPGTDMQVAKVSAYSLNKGNLRFNVYICEKCEESVDEQRVMLLFDVDNITGAWMERR